jgi:hypothetical protein
VSRATAKIGDEPPTACVLGEPIQEMPVERLLSQLRGQMLGVGSGCRIVTFTNIHNASGLDPKCGLISSTSGYPAAISEGGV